MILTLTLTTGSHQLFYGSIPPPLRLEDYLLSLYGPLPNEDIHSFTFIIEDGSKENFRIPPAFFNII